MQVYEITGFQTGVSRAGVNFLQLADSFQNIVNGFIYRQVLQSRQGIALFAPRLANHSRILGIFEHTKPDSTTDLLAVDENFLYKFNLGTGVFDQVPFAGSMLGYPGFNNAAKDFYISGVSYPTATNTQRFIFTGEGITANSNGSSIFFYDGTNVKDFTNVGDNPNFAQYIGGTLTSASYVLWFNERLNFIIPIIGGIAAEQGILYSGIRTASGNGDKFNAVGSGLLQADTYEAITGVTILGQIILLNFARSAWTLEKTTDAFNPYFIRKIPSVLGTNAKFSAVAWNDVVDSVGKTGILEADGRQSLRKDNKVPRFTEDEIDQQSFNLTYGGFDRQNEQFMWSYKESESDSDTQNKVLVRNYEEDSWSVYDVNLTVFGQSELGLNKTWDEIDDVISGNPAWAQWDTTEELWDRIGLGLSVQKTLAGDDLGFIYELNQDLDDNSVSITAIATGATTTLTVSESAFIAGDIVTISNVQGMTQLNNFDPAVVNFNYIPWTIISATPTSVVINADSTLFSPYIPNTGTLSKPINFSAELIPFNPFRSEGRRCYVWCVEFLIDTNGGLLKVDAFADDEEEPYKQDVICYPDQSTTKRREWVTMSIDNEANFHTFKLKQLSPSVQLKVTSIRIHARPGGLTSG